MGVYLGDKGRVLNQPHGISDVDVHHAASKTMLRWSASV